KHRSPRCFDLRWLACRRFRPCGGAGLQGSPKPSELWSIRADRQFNANRRLIQPCVMILFQPSAHLTSLDPNHRIVSRGVASRTLKKLCPNRALFQRFMVSLQPMLNHIRQKLLTPIAGPKELTVEDGFQLAK